MASGTTLDPAERVDSCSRQRTVLLWLELAAFAIWQVLFVFAHPTDWSQRVMTLIWVAVMLLFIGTGGGLMMRRDLRRVMNDELAVAHRHEAQRWGFWAAMLAGAGLYGLDVFRPVSLPIALHVVLSAGLGLALIRYVWLETRAERGG
ncbi:MAG: hypothetical protein E7812_14875 [Phenylobacterium sp.]|nr:MAG: hypothetical protein E7812_14875 [Phenylobacterium sp.]